MDFVMLRNACHEFRIFRMSVIDSGTFETFGHDSEVLDNSVMVFLLSRKIWWTNNDRCFEISKIFEVHPGNTKKSLT